MRNGFDRLARPYRWMEYLSFGRALEHCRFHFLPQLAGVRHALVLGDGDGRFAARLLRTAAVATVTAVDSSPAMLQALQSRTAAGRVQAVQADLTAGLPPALLKQRFDLVATHFFLDCLNTAAVDRLVGDTAPLLEQDGLWVVSEFDLPRGAMRLPAAAIVRLLYLGFRVLAGLRTQRLPDWRKALRNQGLTCIHQHRRIAGLLVAEVWSRAV